MYIYIRSMSEPDAEIYRDIKSKSDLITEHLIKLAYFPKCQECNHWRREIARFLNKVAKRKSNNKYPKEKFIYDALSYINDSLPGDIDNIVYDMAEDPIWRDKDEVIDAIESYQHWLASELSSKGTLLYQDIYNKLVELGF